MNEGPVSALDDMLSGMSPKLDRSPYKFARISTLPVILFGFLHLMRGFAFVLEEEGFTQVKKTTVADKGPLFARITLQVHSDLEGVGLTAAVSTALSKAGIACNVIAAFHHDHLLVPWERREEALAVLKKLSSHAGS